MRSCVTLAFQPQAGSRIDSVRDLDADPGLMFQKSLSVTGHTGDLILVASAIALVTSFESRKGLKRRLSTENGFSKRDGQVIA